MSKVLVAGIETVVGGNLAVCLGRTQTVTGVSFSTPVEIEGCEIESLTASTPENVRQLIATVAPQRLVFCGAGSQSAWETDTPPGNNDVDLASVWIDAARETQTHLTLISSGAVFTGPWMFHSENSQSYCPSPPAQCLRAIEAHAESICPGSFIVRTHAVGWQPGGKTGWVARLMGQLESGQGTNLDCFRHASPILASDLAEMIPRAWHVGLSGVYHIAGAERVNPVQFARRMAHHFQLPAPQAVAAESLIDRPIGYGCGETSLQTRKIRRALNVALPMLEEGVFRLFQQSVDGYRARLTGHSAVPGTRVA